MSNAYTNQILFGHSKSQVNDEYIRNLLPLMLTEERLKECISTKSTIEHDETPAPLVKTPLPLVEKERNEPPASFVEKERDETTHRPSSPPTASGIARKRNCMESQRSLFWSIYELQHPEEAFLQTRANTEIEYRIKVIDALKKTPKRLKETNSKLTLEQTQAIFGAMLTAKEDRIDFCIAYAAYHNKPILVVYSKSYTVFSPTVEVDLSDIDDVIVIYASQSQSGKKSVFYTPERNLTQDVLLQITETKVAGPLKAMSTYKNPELDEIASKLQIATRTSESDKKEKRRKKEDIYNDIRVAIHDDVNWK